MCHHGSKLYAFNSFMFTFNWRDSHYFDLITLYYPFSPFISLSIPSVFLSWASLLQLRCYNTSVPRSSVFNLLLFIFMVLGIIYITVIPNFLDQTPCWTSDISSWMPHRFLRLHISTIELNIIPLESFLSSFLYLKWYHCPLFTCARNMGNHSWSFQSLISSHIQFISFSLLLLLASLVQVQLISFLEYCSSILTGLSCYNLVPLEIHSSEWQKWWSKPFN